MLNKHKPSYLFPNCVPVKGARRSIMYDLQREYYQFMPNDLFDLVSSGFIVSQNELIENYGSDNESTINEYFDFLIKNEFIYQSDNPEYFPQINFGQNTPFEIHNAIIDISNRSEHPYNRIFSELEDLGCEHVEIRFFGCMTTEYISSLVELTIDRIFSSVSITFQHIPGKTPEDYSRILNMNLRIMECTITSSPEVFAQKNTDWRIAFTSEEIADSSCCGNILLEYFRVSQPIFSDSKNTNNCLSHKISIDTNGDIKNCPSMNVSFGNIMDNSLSSALLKKNFKSLWDVSKDKIEVCKDCEFRYMCSDCRAFRVSESIYSKPSKCNYNPYLTQWE